jgi:hypothetical protein
MPKAADEPRASSETPFDRFMRFGTALFAVKKNELPQREDRAKKPSRKKPKGAPGT